MCSLFSVLGLNLKFMEFRTMFEAIASAAAQGDSTGAAFGGAATPGIALSSSCAGTPAIAACAVGPPG